MKLISWNVNGLRACVGKGFLDFFKQADADIFCIQETKMMKEQADFEIPQRLEYWYSANKKGYSGTAVFSKTEPLSCTYGMGIEEHDQEGRVIALEYDKFFLVNVYTPNSKRELLRLDYRMVWEDAFRAFLHELEKTKPVIVCGDLNVAHKEIDIKHPKPNVGNAGFTPQERAKMTELLDSGFIDTYRHFYPDAKDAYTWWSYMASARAKNVGWRIDYFLVSTALENQIMDAEIYADVYGSDHCPIGLILND